MAGGQSISKAASIPFVVHNTGDVSTQERNYYCQAPPHMSTFCLPEITARGTNTKASAPHRGNHEQLSSDEWRGYTDQIVPSQCHAPSHVDLFIETMFRGYYDI